MIFEHLAWVYVILFGYYIVKCRMSQYLYIVLFYILIQMQCRSYKMYFSTEGILHLDQQAATFSCRHKNISRTSMTSVYQLWREQMETRTSYKHRSWGKYFNLTVYDFWHFKHNMSMKFLSERHVKWVYVYNWRQQHA